MLLTVMLTVMDTGEWGSEGKKQEKRRGEKDESKIGLIKTEGGKLKKGEQKLKKKRDIQSNWRRERVFILTVGSDTYIHRDPRLRFSAETDLISPGIGNLLSNGAENYFQFKRGSETYFQFKRGLSYYQFQRGSEIYIHFHWGPRLTVI